MALDLIPGGGSVPDGHHDDGARPLCFETPPDLLAWLAKLRSEVDGLHGVDPRDLEASDLPEAVGALHQLDASLAVLRARLTHEWDRRGTWALDGSKSLAARLARQTRIPQRQAAREVARSRAWAQLPALSDALVNGTLPVAAADALCQARHTREVLFERDHRLLLQLATTEEHHDLRVGLRYWCQLADDAQAEIDADHHHQLRRTGLATDVAGNLLIDARLDAIGGAIVRTELDRLEHELFEADWAEARATHGAGATVDDLARLPSQRRADALVEMARRSAARPADAVDRRPLITVLVGWETFHGRISELADGTVVTAGQFLPLLPAADIERVVFDSPRRVSEVSQRTRFFTGPTRRAIEVRDRHCTHPGCTVEAAKCHVDHIVPYAQGGLTTQENGRLLCPVHNRRRNGPPRARPSGAVPWADPPTSGATGPPRRGDSPRPPQLPPPAR